MRSLVQTICTLLQKTNTLLSHITIRVHIKTHMSTSSPFIHTHTSSHNLQINILHPHFLYQLCYRYQLKHSIHHPNHFHIPASNHQAIIIRDICINMIPQWSITLPTQLTDILLSPSLPVSHSQLATAWSLFSAMLIFMGPVCRYMSQNFVHSSSNANITHLIHKERIDRKLRWTDLTWC